MTLEHLQLLAVLKTDDVIRKYRLLDGHRGLGPFGRCRLASNDGESLVHFLDQLRKIVDGDRVVPDVSRHDLGGQFQQFAEVQVLGHVEMIPTSLTGRDYII